MIGFIDRQIDLWSDYQKNHSNQKNKKFENSLWYYDMSTSVYKVLMSLLLNWILWNVYKPLVPVTNYVIGAIFVVLPISNFSFSCLLWLIREKKNQVNEKPKCIRKGKLKLNWKESYWIRPEFNHIRDVLDQQWVKVYQMFTCLQMFNFIIFVSCCILCIDMYMILSERGIFTKQVTLQLLLLQCQCLHSVVAELQILQGLLMGHFILLSLVF